MPRRGRDLVAVARVGAEHFEDPFSVFCGRFWSYFFYGFERVYLRKPALFLRKPVRFFDPQDEIN